MKKKNKVKINGWFWWDVNRDWGNKGDSAPHRYEKSNLTTLFCKWHFSGREGSSGGATQEHHNSEKQVLQVKHTWETFNICCFTRKALFFLFVCFCVFLAFCRIAALPAQKGHGQRNKAEGTNTSQWKKQPKGHGIYPGEVRSLWPHGSDHPGQMRPPTRQHKTGFGVRYTKF